MNIGLLSAPSNRTELEAPCAGEAGLPSDAGAPTTRGFAGILRAGLNGPSVDEVLAMPGEFSSQLGLYDLVSPAAARSMAAMLVRVKRQIRERRG